MIQKDNLESMIQAIGYIKSERAKVYEKKYTQYDCTVKIDFNGSGSIIYPEDFLWELYLLDMIPLFL